MKKLLVLLLLPLFSFSQTYKDVMSIKSLDTFKKVAIENNYEFDEINDDGLILYRLNVTKWMGYNPKDDSFSLIFSKASFFGATDNTEYDRIYAVVKEKCSYYKIINDKGDDYVCYSCPESSYKGKIGFMIKENWGVINHFPESKSIVED